MIFSISCSSLQRSQNTAGVTNINALINTFTAQTFEFPFWLQKWAITRILHDFFRSFPLHFSGNVLNVISSPLFVGFDELVEITFVPNSKSLQWRYSCLKYAQSKSNTAFSSILSIEQFSKNNQYLLQQVLLLLQFLLCESLGFINLSLLLFLYLSRVWYVWITGNLKKQSHRPT